MKNVELLIFDREKTDESANIAAILAHIDHLDNCSHSKCIHSDLNKNPEVPG